MPQNTRSRKRAAPPATAACAATAEAKKYKSAFDSIADEWVCAITTELPFAPVMAEDGHVYEKTAIEEHIRSHHSGPLKSPMTNLPMGSRLTACPQARNTIEKLVRTGAIGGDRAERWLKRLSDEQHVRAAKEKAEAGDMDSMYALANWYACGEHGLAVDSTLEFKWTKKAADLGCCRSLAKAARSLVYGIGTEKQLAYGVGLAFQAASGGSKYAAYLLGSWFWEGSFAPSLPKDMVQAKHWFSKVASNAIDDCPDRFLVHFALHVFNGDRREGIQEVLYGQHMRGRLLEDLVMHFFQTEGAECEEGCTISQAAEALNASGFTLEQVRQCVENLEKDGHMYSTIDEHHYKAT